VVVVQRGLYGWGFGIRGGGGVGGYAVRGFFFVCFFTDGERRAGAGNE